MTAIFAHRGLHQRARENTIEAFEAACALGVDGVELDVRRSADGRLVVHHDPRVGDLVIAEHRASDLASYVPSLAAALVATRGVRVNVEVKNLLEADEPTYDPSGDFAEAVAAAVRDSGRENDVVYSSFDFATCTVLQRSSSRPVGWLLDWTLDQFDCLERAATAGFSAVNPYVGLVDAALVERARTLGLGLNVWTVNAPADLAAMLALGVEVIITDDPRTAMILRDQGPAEPSSPMA